MGFLVVSPVIMRLFLMMGVSTAGVVIVIFVLMRRGENHQRSNPENGQKQEDDSGRRGVGL